MDAEPCPVCCGGARRIRTLPVERLRTELERYFESTIPASVVFDEYVLCKCSACQLEFASPLKAGSHEFYNWVASRSDYYAEERWEWEVVINAILSHKDPRERSRLLEVGCGSGNFLDKVKSKTGLEVVGLDTTQAAFSECARRGFEVHPLSVERYLEDRSGCDIAFDYVVSFHCLEHVSNPREFLAAIVRLLRPNGHIFISTPYSPIPCEYLNFYPLNNPPHHLTRWNVAAFRQLASEFGLRARFYMPPSQKALVRSMVAAHIRYRGYKSTVTKRSLVTTSIQHPFTLLRDLMHQFGRPQVEVERVGGRVDASSPREVAESSGTTTKETASDIILARFDKQI